MKRIFLLAIVGLASIMVACVDESYDLSNLDTNNTAIGGDESEFLMPLLTMTFTSDNFNQETDDGLSSISQMRENINVWLPTILPNNVDYIDIPALTHDPEYKLAILENLFDEMTQTPAKRSAVCTHIISLYFDELLGALSSSPKLALRVATTQIKAIPDEDKATLLGELFLAFPNDVEAILKEIANNDLIDITLDTVYTEIPSIDISEDIEQMLSENLDPSSVANPINALYLFGEVTSNFPFKLLIHPQIEYTQIDLGEIALDNTTTKINYTRIYQEDLSRLFHGSQLIMPIKLDRYYPNIELNNQSKISISLSLRKTGGLKI